MYAPQQTRHFLPSSAEVVNSTIAFSLKYGDSGDGENGLSPTYFSSTAVYTKQYRHVTSRDNFFTWVWSRR